LGVRCYLLEYVEPRQMVQRTETISSPLMRRVDTGEELILADAPPGAIVDWAELHPERAKITPDGRFLVIKLPDEGLWYVDGRASNCGWPEDNEHTCWARSGEPPDLTVVSGPCPSGGSGSIQTPTYHGHLNNGEFT
jgi:hypothetical protein